MTRPTRTARPGLLSLTLATALGVGVSWAAGPAGADPSKLAPPGKPFTVTVAKVSAQKGQPAKAHVVISPAKGWHLNQEYPTSLKLHPPAGVSAAKADLTKADATLSEQQGSFDVVLTSSDTGKKTVPGDLRFAVCSETSCDPQKSSVQIEMEVK